jgi:hypothetical protein
MTGTPYGWPSCFPQFIQKRRPRGDTVLQSEQRTEPGASGGIAKPGCLEAPCTDDGRSGGIAKSGCLEAPGIDAAFALDDFIARMIAQMIPTGMAMNSP